MLQEHLKSLEVSHMNRLGEEWRKREGQRHELLRKKLEHYSSLERKLQEGLQKLQDQQKTLAAREVKVGILEHTSS